MTTERPNCARRMPYTLRRKAEVKRQRKIHTIDRMVKAHCYLIDPRTDSGARTITDCRTFPLQRSWLAAHKNILHVADTDLQHVYRRQNRTVNTLQRYCQLAISHSTEIHIHFPIHWRLWCGVVGIHSWLRQSQVTYTVCEQRVTDTHTLSHYLSTFGYLQHTCHGTTTSETADTL